MSFRVTFKILRFYGHAIYSKHGRGAGTPSGSLLYSSPPPPLYRGAPCSSNKPADDTNKGRSLLEQRRRRAAHTACCIRFMVWSLDAGFMVSCCTRMLHGVCVGTTQGLLPSRAVLALRSPCAGPRNNANEGLSLCRAVLKSLSLSWY